MSTLFGLSICGRWICRRRVRAGALLVFAAIAAVSCGGSGSPTGAGPRPSDPRPLTLEQSSANFTLRYSEPSAGLVPAYLAELEANLPRILADLDVTPSQRIVGRLHRDRDAFQAATGFIGSGAARGPYLFDLAAHPYAPSDAVHEMAHCVTWNRAPATVSTTWLWESIAVYEARSFVSPASIPDLVTGRFPRLAQLNDLSHRPSVYQVGYTITEFLVAEWGWDAVRQLVVSRGDIESTLGISTAEFEARWQRFVEQRYL
jgi:hypothetical protein